MNRSRTWDLDFYTVVGICAFGQISTIPDRTEQEGQAVKQTGKPES